MITITISGKAGSGKTKLMNLIEKYCNDNKFNYILKEETSKRFYVENPDVISIDTDRDQSLTNVESDRAD